MAVTHAPQATRTRAAGCSPAKGSGSFPRVDKPARPSVSGIGVKGSSPLDFHSGSWRVAWQLLQSRVGRMRRVRRGPLTRPRSTDEPGDGVPDQQKHERSRDQSKQKVCWLGGGTGGVHHQSRGIDSHPCEGRDARSLNDSAWLHLPRSLLDRKSFFDPLVEGATCVPRDSAPVARCSSPSLDGHRGRGARFLRWGGAVR